MDTFNVEKAYSYHLYGSGEDGLVTFIVSVPLRSLDNFVDFCLHRKKVDLAPIRVSDPAYQAAVKDRYDSYVKTVLTTFDLFFKQNLDRNVSVSETNKDLKRRGFANSSYDSVKQILIKSGRFRR